MTPQIVRLHLLDDDRKFVECDVSIRVAGKIFKCHRSVLASAYPYFDVMFRKAFAESNSEEITLHDVDSVAFHEILKYLYCGEGYDDLNITEGNIFTLLRTSEYFGMLDVKRRCIAYMMQNKVQLPEPIVLDIFEYAVHVLKNDTLINNLGEYIAKRLFVDFSQSDLFLDVSFDALITIFRKYQLPLSDVHFRISSVFKDENILLNVLLRWLHHNPEQRMCFLEKLIEKVNFDKISLDYIQYMFREESINSNTPGTSSNDRSSLKEYVVATLRRAPSTACTESQFVPKNEQTLYAFIRDGYSKSIIFINRSTRRWLLSNKIDYSAYAKGRIIGLNEPNRIYSLHLAMKNSVDLQIFQAHSSVSMQAQDSKLLTSPPVIIDEFEMCGMRNSIYVFDSKIACNGKIYKNPKSSSLESFNEEELHRGIYHYNCEVDSWHPVPQMEIPIHNACMVNDHNLVYMIGGVSNDHSYSDLLGFYVQMYDKRTSNWAQLSRLAPKKGILARPWNRCCFFNGKIYRYASDNDKEERIETFDLVAGKWSVFRRGRPFSSVRSTIIPFENQLWLMGNSELAIVDPYDVHSQLWYSSRLGSRTSFRVESAVFLSEYD